MANNSNDELWAIPIIRSFWIVLSGSIIVFIYIFVLSQDLPSIEQLENFDPDLVTRIYSSDGEIIHELFVEKRVFVELDEIPKHMHDAVIASEDRRFRDHWGISLKSVARAIVTNVLAFSYRQGFSTLTQPLARNLNDTIGFRKTVYSVKLKK
jgi:Membrane carboxypeptidase/penicillin-binding protein